MKICEILTTSRIKVEITSTEKEKVIEELIDLFVDDPDIKDINEVKKSILSREKIMSTGVGKGFAIPHAKSDAVKGIVAAFGKSSHPIEYNALDGEPVNLIFVLVGQQNLVGTHIKLLSRISRMMNKDYFRESLLKAQSPEEVYTIFHEEEKRYFDLT